MNKDGEGNEPVNMPAMRNEKATGVVKSSLNETRSFYTPQDVRDPIKLAAILNKHSEQLDMLSDMQAVLDKVWRFVKWGTPGIIGALLASGVVGGPIGKALSYVAAHWTEIIK